MIDENLFFDLIERAADTGWNFVELFYENKTITRIEDSRNHSFKYSNTEIGGLGIRMQSDLGVHFISTNNFSEKNLFRLIEESAISDGKIGNIDNRYYVPSRININTNVTNPRKEVDEEKVLHYLAKFSRGVDSSHSYVTGSDISVYNEVQNVTIINSEGLYTKDQRRRSRLTLDIFVSRENGNRNSSNSIGELGDIDQLLQNKDIERFAQDHVETSILFLDAINAPAGKFPVVIDNGFGAMLFHEACGHGLEATGIIKGESVFASKLGCKISNENITLIDDGTMKYGWGSSRVDDEGSPTRSTELIKKGILNSFLLDNFTAEKLGLSSTGSCRRESYRFAPVPRMTNTYIQNGIFSRDEIIESVKYGILVRGIGGGTVNPLDGRFSFTSNESYLIEGGRITKPLRTVTLVGKSEEVLNNIEMVGNNLRFSEGYCGSYSGNIPISVGQPSIKIGEMMVGGYEY